MKKNTTLILIVLGVNALKGVTAPCHSDAIVDWDSSVAGYPVVNIAKSYTLRLLGVQKADEEIPPLQAKYVVLPMCDGDIEDIWVEALDPKTKAVVSAQKVKIPANPGSTKKQKSKLKTPGDLYGYEVQVGYFATGVSKKPTIKVTPISEKQYKSKKYPALKKAHQMVAIKESASSSTTTSPR